MFSVTHDEIHYIAAQKEKGAVVLSLNGEKITVLYGHPYYNSTPRSFCVVFADPKTHWLTAAIFSENEILEGEYKDIFFPAKSYKTDKNIELVIRLRKKNGEY